MLEAITLIKQVFPKRFTSKRYVYKLCKLVYSSLYLFNCTTPAPPTPTDVTAHRMNASTVRVAWQWTSSDPVPNCFNTTTVTYHPEGGGESSLQFSDPAAIETILTGPPKQKVLHHHCGGHCWRAQEGECIQSVYVYFSSGRSCRYSSGGPPGGGYYTVCCHLVFEEVSFSL